MDIQNKKLIFQSLAALWELDAATVARVSELGTEMSFQDVVGKLSDLKALCGPVDFEDVKHLPAIYFQQISDYVSQMHILLRDIKSFSLAQGNPAGVRQNMISQFENLSTGLVQVILPVLAFGRAIQVSPDRIMSQIDDKLGSAETELRRLSGASAGLEEKASGLLAEAVSTLQKVKNIAAEQGVSQEAIHFGAESALHTGLARKWMIATVVCGILLCVSAFGGIVLHKIDYLAPTSIYESIQLSVGKALFLGTLAYLLFLCARNFLAERHNAIVNKHRQNALLTYEAIVAAAKAEDKRDIVLTHVASCIFSPQETGFAKNGSDTSTVKLIEVAPKIGSGG